LSTSSVNMIQIKKSKKGTLSEFIIRPNPSMPWRVIKKIYFFFSIFILIISLVLCYFGLYLAIPFYGIEVLLLGYALYFTCLKSTFYQIIRISSRLIEVKTVQGKKLLRKSLIETGVNLDLLQHILIGLVIL